MGCCERCHDGGPCPGGAPHRDEEPSAVLMGPAVPLAAHVQGPGAEQAQYAHGRTAFQRALMGTPVANTRLGLGRRMVRADSASPQRFVNHPDFRQAAAASAVSLDTGAPLLPGRPPLPGWDGEPGPGSPATEL